ncbi:MAG: FeoB-associated Cys-rich membrane protein [Bacteroidetes bacterium]|nr:FeoB-associated Cys-rich membrane protein [Bacteroidota bacterium]
MMIQYIIVGSIIASALGSVVYKLIRSIEKPAVKCDGCASGCGGCAIGELKAKKP